MAEQVFLNDKLIDSGDASISVGDSGFLYGAGLFETMRCCNGTVFDIEGHIDRLTDSAKTLAIRNTYEKQYMIDSVYKTLEANGLSEARLRLTLTGGVLAGADEQSPSTLLVTATKLQPYPDEYYQNGIMVVLCPYRQNPADAVCGHKSTSYFSRIKGLNFAHQQKAAEAIWFTTEGLLAEGCISNVFLVKDSVVYTPKLETPVLPGIARKTILKIAGENSIELIEKDLSIDDMLGADEMFVSNVIMQIMPVARIEKHEVGGAKVGEVTKKLQNHFRQFVESQCEVSK